MHELSVCEGLRDAVIQAAHARSLSHVDEVVLSIGVLSGIDRQALEFAFPIVFADTCAAQARLTINRVEAKAECSHCGHVQSVSQRLVRCEVCGAWIAELVGGDDVILQRIRGG